MVFLRVNGPWKINYVIVYIMFSKNNTIDFESFLIRPTHSLVNILQAWIILQSDLKSPARRARNLWHFGE